MKTRQLKYNVDAYLEKTESEMGGWGRVIRRDTDQNKEIVSISSGEY